ncbi:uncharacterized protein LOC144158616 isoform X1 [Haemaphysalis longicornis]
MACSDRLLPASAVTTAAFVLGCLVVSSNGQFADCSASRAQQCETALLIQQVKDASKATVPELLEKCRDIRKNLNCLLNYTALCLPLEQKEEKSRVIVSARKYAYATCEDRDAVKEHWKDGACFQKPEVQRCNSDYDAQMKKYQLNSQFPSDEQCRRYMNYQRCMRRAISQVCEQESAQFLGLYLYDREPTLSWTCSDDYRQPIRIESVPTPALGHLGKGPGAASVPVALNRLPEPLPWTDIEIEGKDAISQQTCVSLVNNDLKRCSDRHSKATAGLGIRKQSSSRKSSGLELSTEEHKTRLCCAFGDYAHCLRTAVQVKCSTDRNALIESIIQQTLEFVGHHCDNYYYGSSLCAAASSLTSATAIVVLAVAACLIGRH